MLTHLPKVDWGLSTDDLNCLGPPSFILYFKFMPIMLFLYITPYTGGIAGDN